VLLSTRLNRSGKFYISFSLLSPCFAGRLHDTRVITELDFSLFRALLKMTDKRPTHDEDDDFLSTMFEFADSCFFVPGEGASVFFGLELSIRLSAMPVR